METVEVIVYIFVALLIGGFVLAFVARIDPGGVYTSVKRVFFGSEPSPYEKVTPEEFPLSAYGVWERCGFGAQPGNATLYIANETGEMTPALLFASYKKLNFCSSIQSAAQSCGQREDVTFTRALTLPTVVAVRCDPVTQTLVLS